MAFPSFQNCFLKLIILVLVGKTVFAQSTGQELQDCDVQEDSSCALAERANGNTLLSFKTVKTRMDAHDPALIDAQNEKGGRGGASPTLYVPEFFAYPDYDGGLEVAGKMTISSTSGTNSTAKQTMTWSLTGLDTSCVANAGDSIANGCGIHIHTGTSCDTAADVGGHYHSSALASDPWAPVVYVADSDGSSSEQTGIDVITGLSSSDITGRVMVVHQRESGVRIACGVIGTTTGSGPTLKVTEFNSYPDYTGGLAVAGTMTISSTSGTESTAKQTMKWSLTGLDTACVANAGDSVANGCGIHIHTGTSCDVAAGVGGHYHNSVLPSDPWSPVVYVAGSDGSSKERNGIDITTGLSSGDIVGRVMVVHDASGARIACGVIETDCGDGGKGGKGGKRGR